MLALAWPAESIPAQGAIVEGGRYWWRLAGAGVDPFNASLKVNGVPLTRDAVAPDDVRFPWTLGFNAGIADVEVRASGQFVRNMRVTVDPVRAKLNRDEYLHMLRDIIEDTRALAATSGLRQGLTAGDADLPIAKVEYVLEHGRRLGSLVTHLDSTHKKRLVRRPHTVPLQSARRMTARDWDRSTRNAHKISDDAVSSLPAPLRELVRQSSNRMPERVAQSKALMDSARREHAEILGLVERVIRLMRHVVARQDELPPEDRDSVLTSRCARLARRMTEFRQLAVFSGLEPAVGAWQYSHLYERVEPYRSLYRLNRNLARGVSSVEGDFVRVPLRETFRLYETWVQLRLVRAAQYLDPALGAEEIFEEKLDQNRLTLSLVNKQIEFLGRVLRFKPTFKEVWLTADGVGSYSREMIPDAVIEFLRPGWQTRSVIVLDAKYRVETQLNAAIESIHTYRDALVREDRERVAGAVKDERIVVAGFVVVPQMPGSVGLPSHWRTEKAPQVLFREGYQDRFNIGALLFRPGVEVHAVARQLEDLARRFP